MGRLGEQLLAMRPTLTLSWCAIVVAATTAAVTHLVKVQWANTAKLQGAGGEGGGKTILEIGGGDKVAHWRGGNL